jgi:CDGSH-type Zn-finger protein
MSGAVGADVRETVCRNGPLVVRGADFVPDGDGGMVAPNRRTVALCRCGSSSIRPWCDGSHKLVAPFDDGQE